MGLFDWQAEENARHTYEMRGHTPPVYPGGAVNVAFKRLVATPTR